MAEKSKLCFSIQSLCCFRISAEFVLTFVGWNPSWKSLMVLIENLIRKYVALSAFMLNFRTESRIRMQCVSSKMDIRSASDAPARLGSQQR